MTDVDVHVILGVAQVKLGMDLIRRHDMADAMHRLHRDGSENNAQARWMIQQLMFFETLPGAPSSIGGRRNC